MQTFDWWAENNGSNQNKISTMHNKYDKQIIELPVWMNSKPFQVIPIVQQPTYHINKYITRINPFLLNVPVFWLLKTP